MQVTFNPQQSIVEFQAMVRTLATGGKKDLAAQHCIAAANYFKGPNSLCDANARMTMEYKFVMAANAYGPSAELETRAAELAQKVTALRATGKATMAGSTPGKPLVVLAVVK